MNRLRAKVNMYFRRCGCPSTSYESNVQICMSRITFDMNMICGLYTRRYVIDNSSERNNMVRMNSICQSFARVGVQYLSTWWSIGSEYGGGLSLNCYFYHIAWRQIWWGSAFGWGRRRCPPPRLLRRRRCLFPPRLLKGPLGRDRRVAGLKGHVGLKFLLIN